ncbi:MAG: hypothetical protein WD030_08585 [Pirellulales bacterium]
MQVRTPFPIINLILDHLTDIRFMRPPIEKPSESPMQFFTPELFVRFNSPDEAQANQADEDWEAAVANYRRHLEGLEDRMPSQVKRLTELSLHDTELLGMNEDVEPLPSSQLEPFWFAIAIVSLKRDNELLSLIYVLWDRLREFAAPERWPFSDRRPHWLYDEIHQAPGHEGARFVHRVLLSDGRVFEIPFLTVLTQTVALTAHTLQPSA